MKNRIWFSVCFSTLVLLNACATQQSGETVALPTSGPNQSAVLPALPDAGRLIIPFDASWRFTQGDPQDAAKPEFDDSAWSVVNLPHDWTILGDFTEDSPSRRGGAYLPTGIGWYRKTFTLPDGSAYAGKTVTIQFDGIMANGEVFLNGQSLGQRPYGYVSVNYPLAGLHVGPGQPNVIAVRVDNSIEPASRYYTGSGIERHVRLLVTNPVHVDTWGLYVVTKDITPLPAVAGSTQTATLHIQTYVTNDSATSHTVVVLPFLVGPDGQPAQFSVVFPSLVGPDGQAAQFTGSPLPPQTIAPGKTVGFEQDIQVPSPKLWDLDHPNLYKVAAAVLENGQLIDASSTNIGIRKAEFKPDTGFWLNGKNIKILGVCLHQDGGAVGEAVPRSIYAARIAAVKAMGANAIRWAHNPPSPDILDLCDRMGILAMDEMFDCWTVAKPNAEQGYNLFFTQWSLADLRDAVVRDRNHPSVILWSAGNEIHDTPQVEKSVGILTGLVAAFHQYDPSRPVTQALFRPNGPGRDSSDFTDGLADLLDVVGANYRDSELVAAQEAVPTRKVINTEEHTDRRTWLYVRDTPQLAGCFLWAGIDYLGEGAPVGVRQPGVDDPSGAWPNISSAEGLFDTTLVEKPLGMERAAWWSTKPVVFIARSPSSRGGGAAPATNALADWTPANPDNYQQAPVYVFSNCDSVELFLNGQSLGAQPRASDDTPRMWTVPFSPGELKAVGKNGGQEVASDVLRTAGKPAKIVLTADQTQLAPDFDDAVIVRATVTDDQGVRVPGANNLVTFSVNGPADIVATDNGAHNDHTRFTSPARHALDGRLIAIVRANRDNGAITLTASADGLASGSIQFTAKPVAP